MPAATPRTAVFPGTFDPVTLGHVDLVRRAAAVFDRVVVGVSREGKTTLFSVEERVGFLRSAVGTLPGVRVEPFGGLVVDFARAVGAGVLVRGVRTFQDWEYELRMVHTNRRLAPELETLFLAPSAATSFLSSSLTREVAALGGDVSSFVTPEVAAAFAARARKG
jgi:pantetheine-phosphate adenylyltransferase